MKEGKEEEKGERRGEGRGGRGERKRRQEEGKGRREENMGAKEGIASLQNITQMSSTHLGNISVGHCTHKHTHTPIFPE